MFNLDKRFKKSIDSRSYTLDRYRDSVKLEVDLKI